MTPRESAADGPAGAASGGPRRILQWLLLWVALLGAGALAFRTDRRVQRDPAFCTTSCHHRSETATVGAHANGHGDVPCQECHAMSRGAGLKLLWQSFTRPEAPDKHGSVGAQTCASCHEKRPAEWRLVAATQGHREHRSLKGVDCLSCHAAATHRSEAPEKACLGCHKEQRLHKASTEAAETCLSCHSYASSPNRAAPPSTVACEKCHADGSKLATLAGDANPAALPATRPMKDVNENSLHGGVACQLCHNAHGKRPKPPEGQPICARCHQFEMFQAGTLEKKGPEAHFKCEGCHKPHAPLKTAITNCITCHEKNAKGLNATGAGTTTALKRTNCASCHLPHSWRAERSGCMQCHKDKAAMILTRSPPEHGACTNCHEVHGPPPTGAVCVTCHSKTKGKHVALAPERHKDCTSCHDPHAPRPADTRTSCAKCHTTELTQVMRDGPDGHTKESCFGCHQPHENPLPPPNICAKCHAERAAVVASAGPPKHRTCTSCHEKHKFKITEVAPVCAKCHGPMFPAASAGLASPTEKVPHQGECRKCHTLHGSPGVPQASCLKCHGDVAAEFKPPNEKHGVCRSCHQPHTPAKTAVAKCATCHEAKALVAAQWPPSSAHAKACNGCHQQHDVRNKKACAECHVPEATSAMGGKHQCMQCHPPHNAPPGRGPAWWARCNECHAAKVESVKERGPTHSACQNCHKPHRFERPACTSCHQMETKGLHSVPKHAASCTSCHDPHVKGDPTPAQCLGCHTDRRGHEPNAARCQACHTFK